jgi:hypothetical protein
MLGDMGHGTETRPSSGRTQNGGVGDGRLGWRKPSTETVNCQPKTETVNRNRVGSQRINHKPLVFPPSKTTGYQTNQKSSKKYQRKEKTQRIVERKETASLANRSSTPPGPPDTLSLARSLAQPVFLTRRRPVNERVYPTPTPFFVDVAKLANTKRRPYELDVHCFWQNRMLIPRFFASFGALLPFGWLVGWWIKQ